MPIEEIREPQTFIRIAEGTLSFEELALSLGRSHSALDFERMRYFVNDFSRVTEFVGYSDSEAETLMATDIGSAFGNPEFSVMFVRPHNATLNAMIEKYADMVSDLIPIKFFNSLDDARAYIRQAKAAAHV